MMRSVTGQSCAVERTQQSLQKAVGGQLVAVGERKSESGEVGRAS